MNNIDIPDDIIKYILKYNCEKCHVCHKVLTFAGSELIQGKFYYCNMKCYNFI